MNPIPYGRHFLEEDDIQAVVDVMRGGGWLTQGPKIAEFEAAVAERVGARHAVAVSNGTAALHIACMAAGVGKGDTVITTPNTFVASANCAVYVGALPQFADIDAGTLNMDPRALEQRSREFERVKAIIPVHFAGLPCDMAAISKIGQRVGSMIIEDAAHALGAKYDDGTPVGNCRYADMTMFSFHPVKSIATAEGGMITTNDSALYRDLLRLRSHGINKGDDPYLKPEHAYTNGLLNPWYYEMRELGFNYRITDLQCALGVSQLRKLDRFLARRRELALRYDHLLAEIPHIAPAQVTGRESSAHHLYPVRINYAKVGTTRAALMHVLMSRNIFCQVHYVPVHYHPYYRELGYGQQHHPVTERYYEEALSLPLYYGLTDEDQDRVIGQIKALLA